MDGSEILMTGGVVAVLAAAVGGGMTAFGIKVPGVRTFPRQIVLFVIGATLIAAGRWPVTPTHAPLVAPAPAPAKGLQMTGANAIDFRPALGETGPRQLLVTVDLQVTNPNKDGPPLVWNDTSAALYIGPSKIPFRPYYFTALNDDPRQWYGAEPKPPVVVRVEPGRQFSTEVMFVPEDAGSGLFSWHEFVTRLFRLHQERQRFVVTLQSSSGDQPQAETRISCEADLGAMAADIVAAKKDFEQPLHLTAACIH